MIRIEFHVDGLPKGQPRPRAFYREGLGTRCYDPGTAEGWKSEIAMACKSHIPVIPIDGPVFLDLHFTLPRPKGHFNSKGVLKPNAPSRVTKKPDLDNMEKAVMDCLTRLRFWHDDAQVADKHTAKFYGHPGCTVIINQLEP